MHSTVSHSTACTAQHCRHLQPGLYASLTMLACLCFNNAQAVCKTATCGSNLSAEHGKHTGFMYGGLDRNRLYLCNNDSIFQDRVADLEWLNRGMLTCPSVKRPVAYLLTKLRLRTQGSKANCSSLRMANIAQACCLGCCQDVVDGCGQVMCSHFIP